MRCSGDKWAAVQHYGQERQRRIVRWALACVNRPNIAAQFRTLGLSGESSVSNQIVTQGYEAGLTTVPKRKVREKRWTNSRRGG